VCSVLYIYRAGAILLGYKLTLTSRRKYRLENYTTQFDVQNNY